LLRAARPGIREDVADLGTAVDKLVEAATSDAKGKTLQRAVSAVVGAFDDAPAKEAKKALQRLDGALESASGHASQVLHLTLGALVEGGASPELAWPAIARGLQEALDGATTFALACAEAARSQHLETALAKAGAKTAKKMPEAAAAWEALPARCLAGVACLTRSAKVRADARKRALYDLAYPLEDAVAEVGFLAQALRVLDDEELLVLHPDLGRGFRVVVSEIAHNGELFAVLSHALVGDPKKGRLPGKRLDRRAMAALTGDGKPPSDVELVAPFHFVTWTGLRSDGSLPPAEEVLDHAISPDAVPADIPARAGVRIILLQAPSEALHLPDERMFDGLSPSARVVKQLTPAAVKKTLVELGRAARRTKRGG
jgi:hypothetical protein